KLVTVFTSDNPDATGDQKVFVGLRYSTNGGASWTNLNVPGNGVNFTASDVNSTHFFEQATDVSVDFDLNNTFYIVYYEHSSDYNSGEIVLRKYDFSGNVPQREISQNQSISTDPYATLYQWSEHDEALTPTMVVDQNQHSYTDPETAQTQVDP